VRPRNKTRLGTTRDGKVTGGRCHRTREACSRAPTAATQLPYDDAPHVRPRQLREPTEETAGSPPGPPSTQPVRRSAGSAVQGGSGRHLGARDGQTRPPPSVQQGRRRRQRRRRQLVAVVVAVVVVVVVVAVGGTYDLRRRRSAQAGRSRDAVARLRARALLSRAESVRRCLLLRRWLARQRGRGRGRGGGGGSPRGVRLQRGTVTWADGRAAGEEVRGERAGAGAHAEHVRGGER